MRTHSSRFSNNDPTTSLAVLHRARAQLDALGLAQLAPLGGFDSLVRFLLPGVTVSGAIATARCPHCREYSLTIQEGRGGGLTLMCSTCINPVQVALAGRIPLEFLEGCQREGSWR